MIELGAFRYDPESRILRRGDEEILLPPRILAVLESLLKRPGRIVTKEEVLESAWDGAFVGEDSLTQAISQLRQALGDDPKHPDYIQTIPRRGYRLIAQVSQPLRSQAPWDADAATEGGVRVGGRSEAGTVGSHEEAGTVGTCESRAAVAGRELRPGTSLGRYELVSPLGAGAMGEVWRARDAQLDREVAIKRVPLELVSEARVMERFRREARLLAALDHPAIATIYAVEEVDEVRFIVMELVHGRTLQGRLEEGALPLEEALGIARQIAGGLEAAHQRGIIHRDLKPGNLILTEDGGVKVLDFGLAKEVRSDDGEAAVASIEPTQAGVLLGTAAYMSPEQARGAPVDRQADIWSFGCVLYEMLAGRRAFPGETASDILAAVLKDRPDWEALPPDTPLGARALLRRCLRRDPGRRLHDIADARIEIEDILEGPAATMAAGPARTESRRRAASAWGPLSRNTFVASLLSALLAVVVTWSWLGQPLAPGGSTAFTEQIGEAWWLTGGVEMEGQAFALDRPTRTAVALSPDGRRLVYAAGDGETSHLFLRSMDRLEAVRIPGTEGAASPFFSPDGRWIGFFAAGSLKSIRSGGGDPRTLLEGGSSPFGAHWGDGDVIAVANGEAEVIRQVPATGGEPVVLTRLADGETGHRLPHLLPRDRGLLFTVHTGEDLHIAFQAPGAPEHEILVENGSDARFLPSGHLVFAREGTLMAAPFDLQGGRLIGDPVRVVEDVMHARFVGNSELDTGAAQFAVSASGTLAYATGGVHPEVDFPLFWLARDGSVSRVPMPPGDHIYPRLSPDGSRIAAAKGRPGNRDLWLHDLRSATTDRLTRGLAVGASAWSPDGMRLVFSARDDGGSRNLFSIAADGTGVPERLTSGDESQYPGSWSTDGAIAFVQGYPPPEHDIWIMLPGEGRHRRPQPFLARPDMESHPAFSPDGGWLAYTSDVTGERQVYVTPYPGPGAAVQISTDGGRGPVWSRDGQRIVYQGLDPADDAVTGRLLEVDIHYGADLTASSPRVVFEGLISTTTAVTNYDVAPDGRLLVNLQAEHEPQPVRRVHVVLGWLDELRRLVSVDR